MILLALALAGARSEAAELDRRLRTADSATATLAAWCAEHHFADPAVIRAEVDRTATHAITSSQRRRLQVDPSEPIRYRRVRLLCGTRLMSTAENWYVPARLSPEINAQLDGGDTPFGTAIRPLAPHRRTVSAERLHGAGLFRHRALVLDAQDRPLAEVVETYPKSILQD